MFSDNNNRYQLEMTIHYLVKEAVLLVRLYTCIGAHGWGKSTLAGE